jgi:hypothetical protein
MWFKKFWVEVLHPRHHTCGSWGPGPFPQVRAPPGLLARCGRSPSSCCRHVDNSTAVHSDRRSSPGSPLVAPCPSPCRVHGRPVRPAVRDPAGVARIGPREGLGQFLQVSASSALSRAAAGRGRTVNGRCRGPASGRISPTCAHSWGQLLDVSTGSTVADRALTRRNRGSAVHGVPHNCGQRHVDPVPEPRDDPVEPAQQDAPQGATSGAGRVPEETQSRARRRKGNGERTPSSSPLAGSGRASGRGRYWRARLLMRAVSSVTWV